MHTLPTILLLAWFGSASAAEPAAPIPAAAIPAAPIPAALREAPPLPGESLVGWAGLGPEQPVGADALDLDGLLLLATAESPRLVEARARSEAAAQAARAAGRPSNPGLELELEPGGDAAHLEATVELSVTDLVFSPLRAAAARPGADAAALLADEEGARFRLDVARAWYDLVAAEQRLRLGQQALDALAAAVDVAEAREVSGSATRLERAARVAAFESARGDVAMLELERNRASAALWQVAGLPAATSERPLALRFPALPAAPPLPDDLVAAATTGNLRLAAGANEARGLRRQAALVRAERRTPELSLGLRGGRELAAATDGHAPVELAVAAHLSLPLFDRGTRSGAALDAEAVAEEARGAAIADQVGATARQLTDRLWTAHARVRHAEQTTLPAWVAVSHETLLAYNAMQVGVYELLAARRQELDAAMALVDARLDYWTASAELDALLAGALPDAAQAAVTRTPGGSAAPSGGH